MKRRDFIKGCLALAVTGPLFNICRAEERQGVTSTTLKVNGNCFLEVGEWITVSGTGKSDHIANSLYYVISVESSNVVIVNVNCLGTGRDPEKLVDVPIKRNYEHMMRIHRKKKGWG